MSDILLTTNESHNGRHVLSHVDTEASVLLQSPNEKNGLLTAWSTDTVN